MIISSDWHIHSEYSCDNACMKMETLVSTANEKGITSFGITDHIHTPYNYPDIIKSRESFLRNRIKGFHFGVEVSSVSKWELNLISRGEAKGNITYGVREGGPAGGELAIAIDEGFIEEFGVEYVVGGTHWPMYTNDTAKDIIEDYHRQNMFLAGHKLVDIVAHPWWCMGKCESYWPNDFLMIPGSMHKEFAKSCIENNKLVEINLGAMVLARPYSDSFKKQYMDYLVMLKEEGVRFTIGSDCHQLHYEVDFKKASDILEKAGFSKEDFFNPI